MTRVLNTEAGLNGDCGGTARTLVCYLPWKERTEILLGRLG